MTYQDWLEERELPQNPAGLCGVITAEMAEDFDTWEHHAATVIRALASERDALKAREAKLREALVLAQKWLANCVPVVHLDGPKPLPVIAAALAEGEDTPQRYLWVVEVQWADEWVVEDSFPTEAAAEAYAFEVRRNVSAEVRVVRYSAEDTRG